MTGIRTPDQRVRVFISSTLTELAEERRAAREAIGALRLTPVFFEAGARPYPPRELYSAYLEQSHVFVGIYWNSYGWVAPGAEISGLEDEYRLCSRGTPKLIYVKRSTERQPRLDGLLADIQRSDSVCYQSFTDAAELQTLLEGDLGILMSEMVQDALAPRPAVEAFVAPRVEEAAGAPPVADAASLAPGVAGRSTSRRAAWLVAAGLVASVGVMVGAWALQPRPLEVFTLHGVPEGDLPAGARADLERAWFAWQDGDMASATRLARRVVAAAPDEPAGLLMHGFAAAQNGDVLETARTVKRVEELEQAGKLGPGPYLDAMAIYYDRDPGIVARCAAFATAWPEDLLVRTMCAVRSPGDPEVREARARQLREHAPDLVVAWHHEVEVLWGSGRVDEAAQRLDEALARHPEAALLHVSLALIRRERGELADARAALARALELDPALTLGRSLLAQLELEAGQTAAFEAQDAVLRSSATSAFDRGNHALVIAGLHGSWGRFGDAARHLDLAEAAFEERGDMVSLAGLHGWRFDLHREVGDLSGARDDLLRLSASLSVPEFPDDWRGEYILGSVRMAGVLAAESGDLELATRQLGRALEAGAEPGELHGLELSIAQARGDVARVAELVGGAELAPCDALGLGLVLADIGAWEDAGPPLDRWHAAVDSCGTVDSTRPGRALGALRRARIASRAKRTADARTALAEFHTLWPDYDPQWVHANEVAALDAELAAP